MLAAEGMRSQSKSRNYTNFKAKKKVWNNQGISEKDWKLSGWLERFPWGFAPRCFTRMRSQVRVP